MPTYEDCCNPEHNGDCYALAMAQERYLYHCFPRRGANTAAEITKGLEILKCIRDFGLLLLPESIEWSQPVTGQAPRTFPVIQPRVCFTDLSPAELPEHATRFGHFALEFEMESARQLGAIPVFYVPQRGGGVGTSLLAILLDARAVIDRARITHDILNGKTPVNERIALTVGFTRNPQDKQAFDIHRDESKVLLDALDHQITPWPMLSTGMDALAELLLSGRQHDSRQAAPVLPATRMAYRVQFHDQWCRCVATAHRRRGSPDFSNRRTLLSSAYEDRSRPHRSL
jgi:hypothetical protein